MNVDAFVEANPVDSVLNAIAERVRLAAASRRPLRIQGGGSKHGLGPRPEGDSLDMRAYAGIVDYVPSELVITARAGTCLRDIEQVLFEHGQMLAFEPPHSIAASKAEAQIGLDGVREDALRAPWTPSDESQSQSQVPSTTAHEVAVVDQATIGGAVASGLSGPRRIAYGPLGGSVRDFVLGARLVDGRGQVLRFGGAVMKNVAGYDVSRLMVGSFGVLGVIVEVSIKVMPRPAHERSVRFEMSEARAIRSVNAWATRPLPISASAWCGGQDGALTVRLSGDDAAVRKAANTIGGEALDDREAHDFWRSLRDQTHPMFDADDDDERASLWRLSLPSNTPVLDVEAGARIVEWNGAQRWIHSASTPHRIREAVGRAGGHATLWHWNGRDEAPPWMTPLPAANAAIQRRLKAEFDSAGVLNRGRLYADL